MMNTKHRTFTAWLRREENVWISLCLELDVASQGDSEQQARSNLQEAVELFLECAPAEEVDQRMQQNRLTRLEVTLA